MTTQIINLPRAIESLLSSSIPLVVGLLLVFTPHLISATAETEDYFATALASDHPIRFVNSKANLRDIAWSPDGKWISFGSIESGNADIWIRRADGGKNIQVTFDEANDVYASWAPDGTTLLWASDRSGRTNLWTKNPFTDEAPQQITTDADSLSSIGFAISSFSPDGSQIAFTSSKAGNDDIWVHNLHSGTTQRLTQNEGRDFIPHSWSPDGSQIAFTSDRATPGLSGGDIWIVEVDSKAERQLTTAEGWEWCPAWSPDGRFIIYSHTNPSAGGVHIYASAADGSRRQKILATPFFGATVPNWMPGGTMLTFNGGHRRASLFTFKAGAKAHTELPIGDQILDLRASQSGALLAVAALEDTTVVIKQYRIDQEPLQGKAINHFSATEWIGAQIRWHPDEQSILLQLIKPDKSHVLSLLETQNGNLNNIVVESEILMNQHPWSPSGKRLAYIASHGEGNKDIFTFSLRNLKKRQITFGGVMPQGYDWSPDGRQLVYGGKGSGQTKADLYTVPATRGKVVHLLNWENSSELNPQFSPDGKYISFVSDRGGLDALWLFELASGKVQAIEGGNIGVFNNPLWNKDSSGITFQAQGQGQVYRYDLVTDKTTLIYRGQSWARPIGWNPNTGLLLRGNKEGGHLWLMRAPKLEPEI